MQLNKNVKDLEIALQSERAARIAAEADLKTKSEQLEKISAELSKYKSQELQNQKSTELKGVFENITDAFVVMELSGEVINMNQAAIELLGYDYKEEPFNLISLVKPDYIDYTFEAFKELLIHGKFNNYRAEITTRDGEEKTVHINTSIIYNSQAEPVAAQGIARDITQESKLKQLLIEQKQQLDIIYKNSPIGVGLANTYSGGLIMVNNAMSEMLGYTPEEFKKITVDDITHPEDLKATQELRKKIFAGEINTFTLEKRYFKKNGGILWGNTSVTAVRDEKDELNFLVATLEDITEKKEASNKLKESENRMATLIMNLQTGIMLEDENQNISLINQKFCALFKIKSPPEDLKGISSKITSEIIQVLIKDQIGYKNRISQLKQNKTTVLGEELRLTDGRILELNYIPIYNEGDYNGHLWSYDDVTIRRTYKESLKAQKEKYSNIIANMNLGLLEIDMNNKIIMANHSFLDLSGYSREALIGKDPAQLFSADTYFKRNNNEGLSKQSEIPIVTKKGDSKTWLVSSAPNYNMNGVLTGYIFIHLDITERKELEDKQVELLRNLENQNDQLNDYAHIVSHDLKSPLRNISALLSWTKEDLTNDLKEESLKNIDLIQGKIEKMDHLIENILKYSSIDPQNLTSEKVNVQEVVEDIISMIYIPSHITVTIKSRLPVIIADTTRIQQLFQNLIINAVNYIDKDTGIVEIDLSHSKTEYIFSVKDNGCGIPKAYHQNIYKIFHSVSDEKNSAGIGLSIVKKIIDLYHGRIWLESEPGVGTTFFFSLKKTT
ncbi:PAS domain S-box protein [Christiangramia aquimixticola]|uniref:PAS domain S-box protein n=1 Tax=Christiangramia aquimixticola TaxID=1697558 RepID=UPI003AA98360